MANKLIIIAGFLFLISLAFVSSITGGDSFVIEKTNHYDEEQQKTCSLLKGCFVTNDECYPSGYIKDGQACFEENFINQSESGETCAYDFECNSNFCFNGQCISDIKSLLVDIIQRIFVVEDKLNASDNLELNNSNEGNETEEAPKGITGFFARLFR